MKIIFGIHLYDKEEILEFVDKHVPVKDAEFTFREMKENAGWIYMTGKINSSDFSINYSSYVMDTSYLIKFFEEIINLKEDTAIFLDCEGMTPLLYAKKSDDDNIRFLFAHDYELYKQFCENDIEDYDLSGYKIDFDIIIDKKVLLKKFYDILYPFTVNYNLEEAYSPVFDIEKGKKYLGNIEEYLKQNKISNQKTDL